MGGTGLILISSERSSYTLVHTLSQTHFQLWIFKRTKALLITCHVIHAATIIITWPLLGNQELSAVYIGRVHAASHQHLPGTLTAWVVHYPPSGPTHADCVGVNWITRNKQAQSPRHDDVTLCDVTLWPECNYSGAPSDQQTLPRWHSIYLTIRQETRLSLRYRASAVHYTGDRWKWHYTIERIVAYDFLYTGI